MARETHPTPDAHTPTTGYGAELETTHADTAVDVHHAPTHVVSYNPDAPSEEWGWHGEWRDFAPKHEILLWLGVFGLVAMGIFGNHNLHIYDYWMVALGVLMAGWIVWRRIAHKREVRRRP